MVGGELAAGEDLVVVFRALHGRRGESRAELDALHAADGEYGVRGQRVELVEDGFAESGRKPERFAENHAADAVGRGFPDGPDHAFRRFAVGRADGIAFDLVPVDRVRLDPGDFDGAGADADAVRREDELGDGSGRHTGDRFASGRSPASAGVAESEFAFPCVIGVAGPEEVRDRIVVAAFLIGVPEEDGERCAGGDAVEHAGEDFGFVRFGSGRGHAGLAGATPGELGSEEIEVDAEPGGDAVDDAAESGSVGFAERGDAEERAEGVGTHLDEPFVSRSSRSASTTSSTGRTSGMGRTASAIA